MALVDGDAEVEGYRVWPIGSIAFAPKFWEVAGTYESFFCHSMNAGSMVAHTMRWWGPSKPTIC